MNKTQRFGTLAATAFAITLVATLALVPLADQQAFAKKPLPNFDDAERLLGINLIGMPNSVETDGKCDINNSKNVYTVRGEGHEHLLFVNGTNNTVVDHCTDAIDGDDAVLTLDVDDIPNGDVFYTVRMLGKPGGNLTFCSTTVTIHNSDHCIIGVDTTESFDRGTGKPGFSVPKKLFDDPFDNQVWSMQIGTDFRIAQIDVWVIPQA